MNRELKKYTIIIFIYSIALIFVYPKYYFLVWNIFLAYIPFLLSFNFKVIKNKIFKILNFILFMIFLPNSFYVFTDLIHIQNMKFYTRDSKKVKYIMNFENWLKLALIFIAILIVIKISYISINNYLEIIKSEIFKHIIIIMICFLTGIAIFIGRFVRLNSWDLIISPIKITKTIFSYITMENIKYILLFSLISYIIIIFEKK